MWPEGQISRRSGEDEDFYVPVTLFSPLPLVSDDVDNLSTELISTALERRPIDYDEATALDPNSRTETSRQFDQNGLLHLWQFDGVQIVPLGFVDLCDGESLV